MVAREECEWSKNEKLIVLYMLVVDMTSRNPEQAVRAAMTSTNVH